MTMARSWRERTIPVLAHLGLAVLLGAILMFACHVVVLTTFLLHEATGLALPPYAVAYPPVYGAGAWFLARRRAAPGWTVGLALCAAPLLYWGWLALAAPWSHFGVYGGSSMIVVMPVTVVTTVVAAVWSSRRTAALASLAVLALGALAACGDDPAGPGGPAVPDLVGTYFGAWEVTISVPATGQQAELTCPGIADVSSQSADGSFAGRWTQGTGENCTVAFGTLAGHVEDGGAVVVPGFTNASGESFEETTGGACTVVSGPDVYAGRADGFVFEISRTARVDCGGPDILYTWKLTTRRT